MILASKIDRASYSHALKNYKNKFLNQNKNYKNLLLGIYYLHALNSGLLSFNFICYHNFKAN